jgi:phosphate acetyltransferase
VTEKRDKHEKYERTIVLTSRADSLISRLASCAVAMLVAKARRERPARTIV